MSHAVSQSNRAEVKLNVLLAVSGALIIICTLVPHGLWHHIGFIALAIPLAFMNRHRDVSGAHAPDDGDFLRTLSLAGPLLVYIAWSRLFGVSLMHAIGSMVFLIGLMLFAAVLNRSVERYIIVWAVMIQLAGLVVITADRGIVAGPASIDTVFGAMLLCGGLLAAAFIRRRDQPDRA